MPAQMEANMPLSAVAGKMPPPPPGCPSGVNKLTDGSINMMVASGGDNETSATAPSGTVRRNVTR
jgi:hypothetical protein